MIGFPTNRVTELECKEKRTAIAVKKELKKEGYDKTSYKKQKDGTYRIHGSWSKKKQRAAEKRNRSIR